MNELEEDSRLMREAMEVEGEGQRLLLAGDRAAAAERLRTAAGSYRRSWAAAGPTAYGRLVGMLKAAVIAGRGEEEATYARGELGEETGDSPVAAYALAVAALIDADDALAAVAADRMRGAGEAFDRTAEAVAALAAGDPGRYSAAVRAIVADFESREEHLTGVPIADTAVMLEELARRRGLAAGVSSPLLPLTG